MKRVTVIAIVVWCALCASSFATSMGPWKLKELRKVPGFKWVDSRSPVRSLLYSGLSYEGKPTSIFAYYASPGTLNPEKGQDKGLPAVIFLHGGGGRAYPSVCEMWAKRGYAALAIDVGGCGEQKTTDGRISYGHLPDGGPDQNGYNKFRHITKPVKDQWPYHAVADAVLANSLLRSFPEVDPKRIGLTGSSWGGFLTCIVAGVDSRFACAAPVYGCGYIYEKSIWKDEMGLFDEMTPENRKRWVELWDPSRYIGHARMPMLFLDGTSDFAYPIESAFKTYKTAPKKAKRWLSLHSPLQHDDSVAASALEVELFMNSCLRGGLSLPVVTNLRIVDGRPTVDVKSESKLRYGSLYYTKDKNGKLVDRKWRSISSSYSGGTASAPMPPADCYAWYFGFTDERYAVVASDVVFPGEPDDPRSATSGERN